MASPVTRQQDDIILSNLAPSQRERRLAFAVACLVSIGLVVTAGPLSSVETKPIIVFVPIYATALFVTDLITAVLLFAHFTVVRSYALLAIASGYLFTALIAIAWMMTFPDVFAAGGLLGAGLNTTNWLYIFWHSGFPLFVIAYSFLKHDGPFISRRYASTSVAIFFCAAVTLALVCVITLFVTVCHDQLPHTMADQVHFSALRTYVAVFQVFLNVGALLILWIRGGSALDLWLKVVMWAYTIEVALIVLPNPMRFSIGWYLGRTIGLVAGSLVMFVLLVEISMLYGQLLRALQAQRREEQARLTTGGAVAASIAHQINQPLAAMVLQASVGLRWLARVAPQAELGEVKESLDRIIADGRRVAAIIEGIRAIFRRGTRKKTLVDMNELVSEAIAFSHARLTDFRVTVQTDLHLGLQKVAGDPIQLQQALLNLIANAIEAMAENDGPRILSVGSAPEGNDRIAIWVADTGTGVPTQDAEHLFDPLFTTKAEGMGMGLSICRSIIESHQGEISISQNAPRGAVFRFLLPIGART